MVTAEAGDRWFFTTDGALPTGITSGTTCYVLSSGLTATDFQIAATAGGTAIDTSGSQSGTHTVTSQPGWRNRHVLRPRRRQPEVGRRCGAARLKTWMIARYSNLVTVWIGQLP